jgi:enamine deaminase RidA (YjgF/YER057c/UK114 family)
MSEQDVLPQPGHKILQPAGWAAPRGYSNGIEARGRTVVIGGQIGWDGQCRFHTSDFAAQARQALAEHRRRSSPRPAASPSTSSA